MIAALRRNLAAAVDEITAPRQGLRLVIGILAGIAAGSLVGGVLVLAKPIIDNHPNGLFAFWVYLEDVPIDNRMFAAKTALLVSLVVFLGVSFSRFSKKLAERLVEKFQPTRDDFVGKVLPAAIKITGRLTDRAVNWGHPDRELAEYRRRQAKWLLPGLFFSAAVVTALMAGVEKLYILFWPETAAANLPSLLAGLRWLNVVIWPLPILTWLRFPDRGLPRLVLALQFGLLPFFFLLVPDAVLVEGRPQHLLPPFKITFIACVLVLIGAADILIRFNRAWGRKVFSRVALFALLMGGVLPYANTEAMFHFGLMFELSARIPQVWMAVNGWGGLFSDFYITYGLYDALGIILGWQVYGQTVIGAEAGMYSLLLVLLAAGLFAAALRVMPLPLAWALVYMLNAPATFGMTHFFNVAPASIIFIYVSLLLYPPLLKQPGRWLIVWGLLSAFMPFFRIPQGAVTVLASMPGALVQLIILWRGHRSQVWKIGGFFLILTLVVTVWPFGRYFYGLIRMFLETGAINSAWGATESSTVQYLSDVFTRPWNILVICAYGLLPMLAFVVALYLRQNRADRTARAVGWCSAGFVLIYTLATITYAFACGYYWRSYQVSVSLAVVMGLVVWMFCQNKTARYLTLAVLFCIVTCFIRLTPEFSILSLESSSFVKAARGISLSRHAQTIVNGADYGLPRFGRGQFIFPQEDQELYLTKLAAAKEMLDKVLSPDETFLNLASDASAYFLFDRKLPLEYPFPFLFPGVQAQKRAIQNLERSQVRTSLWYPAEFKGRASSNINSGLVRADYLFRYAVANGLPVQVVPSVFIIIPEERFELLGLTPPDKSEILRLYDLISNSSQPMNLMFTSITWGREIDSFKKRLMQKVRDVPLAPTGDEPGVWQYSFQEPFRGLDGGLLVLDLEMPGESHGPDWLEVSWVMEDLPEEVNKISFFAKSGTLIVPLDFSARWLLADSIKSIRVQSMRKNTFSVKGAGLYAH